MYGPNKTRPSGAFRAGIGRSLIGAVNIGIAFVGLQYFPIAQLRGSAFLDGDSLLHKLALIWGVGALTFARDTGIWVLNEGASIIVGLAYNGDDNTGAKWDGLSSVSLWKFWSATSLIQCYANFHMNRGQWMSKHVIGRLGFISNANVKSIVAYVFLSVWLGLQPGYVCME